MAERIIICGTGSIGMQYAAILRGMGIDPMLIPVRAERCKELKSEGYTVAKELDSSIADSTNCCIIATETKRHVEDALRAMGLGLRVLVEKPLGVSVEDICRFKRTAGGHGLDRLRVACPLRWYEAVAAVKENLVELGQIHTVNICCQSYLPDWRPRRNYKTSYSASLDQGGVVRDLVHEIDYCNYLFGLPSAGDIQFSGVRGGSIGIESTSNAILSWGIGGQTLVSIQLDYLTRSAKRSICVYGEKGEIKADLISGEVKCVLAGGESKIQNVEVNRDAATVKMLESFIKDDGLGCTFQQALEAAEIIDVCEMSMRDLK